MLFTGTVISRGHYLGKTFLSFENILTLNCNIGERTQKLAVTEKINQKLLKE